MSWTTSSWTVQKFTPLECRDKCHDLKAPLMNLLYDWCWPCFYIVFISTSTTKCFFSQFPFLQQIIKRVAKCMNALNVYILDKAATLHPYVHDIWVVVGEAGWWWGGSTSVCSDSTFIATSQPLGFTWNTFHSWVASLYARDCVDVSLIIYVSC